jgi:hypothetical protein
MRKYFMRHISGEIWRMKYEIRHFRLRFQPDWPISGFSAGRFISPDGCARRALELPGIFMIFDSAFALIWKIFYVEKRALVDKPCA